MARRVQRRRQSTEESLLSVVAASSSSAQAIVPGIIEGTGLTAIRSAGRTVIDTTN
ncbi:MAG: hypothetical protein VYD47_05545 [Actinomycetota bacterium]|nr:hypothetical protein [Actinomycetota bacterium]